MMEEMPVTRLAAGKSFQRALIFLSYIEGWHTIAEANRIFGYDAWDRPTMAVKCVWEGMKGHGVGLTPGEAHESAIKAAENRADIWVQSSP